MFETTKTIDTERGLQEHIRTSEVMWEGTSMNPQRFITVATASHLNKTHNSYQIVALDFRAAQTLHFSVGSCVLLKKSVTLTHHEECVCVCVSTLQTAPGKPRSLKVTAHGFKKKNPVELLSHSLFSYFCEQRCFKKTRKPEKTFTFSQGASVDLYVGLLLVLCFTRFFVNMTSHRVTICLRKKRSFPDLQLVHKHRVYV